jgi:hypothetical protein
MSSNRVQYFIRNILQNSKLNREKFVKNKKLYNDLSVKNKRNHNLILKRNFNTNSYGLPPPNNNNNNYWMIFTGAIVTYIVSGKFNKKN